MLQKQTELNGKGLKKNVFTFFHIVLKRLPPQGLENSEMCAPGSNLSF